MNKFNVGDKVIITSQEDRGIKCTVVGVEQIPGTPLIDYKVKLADKVKWIRGEDLILDGNDQTTAEIGLPQINIKDYLNDDSLYNICSAVCKEKVSHYVDTIIHNRTAEKGSIVDLCIIKATDDYVDKLLKDDAKRADFEERFMNAIHEEIGLQAPEKSDEETDYDNVHFRIRCKLETAVDEYIKEHNDEIMELMKDGLVITSREVASHKLAEIIGRTFTDQLVEYIDNTILHKEPEKN